MNSRIESTIIIFLVAVVLAKTESEFTCTATGRYPHATDPTKFHECHYVGENNFTMFLQHCPQDTCFDATAKVCSVDYCEQRMEAMNPPTFFNCPTTGKFPLQNATRNDVFYKCIELHGKLYAYEYQCLPAKPCFSYRRQMCQPC